jgi:hypothetical protein
LLGIWFAGGTMMWYSRTRHVERPRHQNGSSTTRSEVISTASFCRGTWSELVRARPVWFKLLCWCIVMFVCDEWKITIALLLYEILKQEFKHFPLSNAQPLVGGACSIYISTQLCVCKDLKIRLRVCSVPLDWTQEPFQLIYKFVNHFNWESVKELNPEELNEP